MSALFEYIFVLYQLVCHLNWCTILYYQILLLDKKRRQKVHPKFEVFKWPNKLHVSHTHIKHTRAMDMSWGFGVNFGTWISFNAENWHSHWEPSINLHVHKKLSAYSPTLMNEFEAYEISVRIYVDAICVGGKCFQASADITWKTK